MRIKVRNLPISTYKKITSTITWIWETNGLVWFGSKKCRRRKWHCGLITSWNQFLMQSLHIYSFFEWLISLVHEGYVDMHVEKSSISDLNDRSPSDVVPNFLAFFIDWQGKYFCSSGNFGPSSISREVDKFLAATKIYYLWEGEILATSRIWESSSKLMIVFEFILLVDES